MAIITEFLKDKLLVKVFTDRVEMGTAAAKEGAAHLKKLLSQKAEINVMFAAAPSQNEFLTSIITDDEIDWSRVNGYHMDEYIGLDELHPAGFGNFLRDRIFSKVPFKSVSYLNGNATDPKVEAERYSKLLLNNHIDVCFMGIGENGHIAFNDPPVADFNDPVMVKVVELEDRCRMQQVHDGCFHHIDEVPAHALSVTVPGLMSAKTIFCIVPAISKANAVRDMINDEISTVCPATILRSHRDVRLYLDADSGKYLL